MGGRNFSNRPLAVMPSHEDFSSNYFVCWTIVYCRPTGELLSAGRAFQVPSGEVLLYAADVALDQLATSFLSIEVKRFVALLATNSNDVRFCPASTHGLSPNDDMTAPNFGGQTPTHALQDMQEPAMTASGLLSFLSTSDREPKAHASMQMPQPLHFSSTTTGIGDENVCSPVCAATRPVRFANEVYSGFFSSRRRHTRS